MARNLQVNTLIGTYADGTDLYPVIRSTLAAELSTVGITGVGLPNIYILGFNGVSTSGISLKLSNISKLAAMPYNGAFYSFDSGIYSDNLHIPVSELHIETYDLENHYHGVTIQDTIRNPPDYENK
jgi:hypothetical protein